MKRTDRIEMVLLHTSNELKKKYKLLRKLRLCLNIVIKNEEKKNPSSGCFQNPSYLTTYPVNPNYLTIVS